MRAIFLVLALLIGLAVAVVAISNNEVVTVNYLFGQISLSLFMLVLGSAFAGALFMSFLGIFRGIQKYTNSQGERGQKKDMQHRIKSLEDENKKLSDELNKHNKDREDAAKKKQDALENENRKLDDELKKQQQQSHKDAVANANSR